MIGGAVTDGCSRRAFPGWGPGVSRGVPLSIGVAMLLTFTPATRANDPMRPLNPEAPTQAASPAAPSSAPAPQAPPPPALLATRRGADGHWEALVDRRWLRTGDRLGGARVAEVHGDRVVLARGGRRETLWLLPPLTPPRPTAARP